jgi:acyl-CoA synthetase (AMP-forming)/AMP-acid ligase II
MISETPAHQKNTRTYVLQARTLVEMLHLRARKEEHFLLFMDMQNNPHPIGVADTVTRCRQVARQLMARGLTKDDKVVLMLPTGPEFVYLFFGTLMAGGVPVPVSQPAHASHLDKYLEGLTHILRDCEARFFIAHDKLADLGLRWDGLDHLRDGLIFPQELLAAGPADEDGSPLPELHAEDAALIQYTSGTTGLPKGVVLSHANILHNLHAIGLASAITPDDVGLSWLPLYHDMGLIGGLLTAIYWQSRMIFMRPEAFIFNPHWYLRNIGRFGVTVGVSPNFGYHYCVTRIGDETLETIDLSTWRVALNGAEPIDHLTLKKFCDKFRRCGLRDNIFLTVYGMAENSLAATFPALDSPTVVRSFDRRSIEERHLAVDAASEDPKEVINLVSVGYPVPGQQVRIADKNGVTLMERQVGQILIHSPSLTGGYYKNPEATQATMPEGWLRTGDLGFILDGQLFISGRSKEIIIKRGKNIYPYDVERVAATIPGVRLGGCAAFAVPNAKSGTEDLVLVCEAASKNPGLLDQLPQAIANATLSQLGLAPDQVRIVAKGKVPKTTSGKLQRLLCKRMYLQGELCDLLTESA